VAGRGRVYVPDPRLAEARRIHADGPAGAARRARRHIQCGGRRDVARRAAGIAPGRLHAAEGGGPRPQPATERSGAQELPAPQESQRRGHARDRRRLLSQGDPRDARANAALVARSASKGLFTAAQYRDATGIGRNLTIKVLEFFDTLGITQRIGDTRKMHKTSCRCSARQSPPSPRARSRDGSPESVRRQHPPETVEQHHGEEKTGCAPPT